MFKEEIGNCGSEITIDIDCTATEVDIPAPDEVGTATTQVRGRCPSQELVMIPVTVDSAVMTFVRRIEANCRHGAHRATVESHICVLRGSVSWGTHARAACVAIRQSPWVR